MTAVGRMRISEAVEGRERYPISVRYAREFRDDPNLLKEILVTTKTGAQIPIIQVADIRFVTGPPMIRSEDGKLVGFFFVDTERPIADHVQDARRVIAEHLEGCLFVRRNGAVGLRDCHKGADTGGCFLFVDRHVGLLAYSWNCNYLRGLSDVKTEVATLIRGSSRELWPLLPFPKRLEEDPRGGSGALAALVDS